MFHFNRVNGAGVISSNTGCESEDENGRFPLYPEFNDRTAELNADMFQDWISILLQENRQRIESVDDTFLLFVDPRSVEYLFTICLRMRLPHDVKYIALAIFSEFMVAHIVSLYGMIADLPDRTQEQKAREWEKVETTVSRQLSLRIVSCIQIASKIHCYNESLSTKRVRRCLQLLGLAYTEEAVRRSELRILMTLDFCSTLRHTPVVYVESVLAVFNKLFEQLSAAKLWEYSLLFLDCVYLRMDEVYRQILVIIHGPNGIQLPKDRLRRLQADYMLLAVGVVATACVCQYGISFGDKAVEMLAKISRITAADILDFSAGLMKTVLDYGGKTPPTFASGPATATSAQSAEDGRAAAVGSASPSE